MQKNIDYNRSYPLLPLRDLVVFPENVSSLFVGRDKSMEATKQAMDADRLIVLTSQKESSVVLPEKTDLCDVGVLCEILQLLKMPDGTFKILVEGLSRVSVRNVNEAEEFDKVDIEHFKTILPFNKTENELLDKSIIRIKQKFTDYIKISSDSYHEVLEELDRKQSAEEIGDSIAHLLKVSYSQKQLILENANLLERIEKVHIALGSELDINDLEASIHSKVRIQMDKMQRKFYLLEQMKVIKEEMNEGEKDEIDDYKEKLKSSHFPEDVVIRVEQEIKKLEKMPLMTAESTVARNYLDWLVDLPWNKKTQDNKDIKNAEDILEASHFGLEKVKDRLLEFIAVRQLSENTRGPILCLSGPPGVGKTTLAKSLAKALGRKFARISLGGVRDEAEIRGHRRTYIGAMPGRIISAIKKSATNNPVILLDELDKISSDYRGNPAAALLEVLDPEQNSEFTDHYLEIPFDISKVLFIATANVTHTIPAPLLDRLEIIEVSSYTEYEKIQIIKSHLFPEKLSEAGLKNIVVKYNSKSLSYIIRHYTREAGVRQVGRELDKICRKIAREVVSKVSLSKTYVLDKETIKKFLGSEKLLSKKKGSKAIVGMVNGLAWTSTGGDILGVEVALSHGKGKISITGNLGDVMKESANTALGYVKSKSHLLNLENDFFERTDLFIHVPEGAIPKDGPSAGVTLATCIISSLSQIAVRHDVAMTGEITLRGLVLPIGGLREKALAAYRAGITEIICPEENKKDLVDIPEAVSSKIKFHFVTKFEDVIEFAFSEPTKVFRERPGVFPFSVSHLSWQKTDSSGLSKN